MKRRVLDIFCSPVFGVVLLLALVAFNGRIEPNINQRGERNRDGSANDGQRVSAPISTIQQSPNAAAEQRDGNGPDQQKNYEEEHLKFEKTIAEADNTIAWFTILLVAVGAATAGLELWALSLTRKSANAAMKAANAAENAFEQSKQSSEQTLANTKRQLRAYVFVGGISLSRKHPNVIQAYFNATNAGMTPATELQYGYWTNFSTPEDSENAFKAIKAMQKLKPEFIAAQCPELFRPPVEYNASAFDGERMKIHEARGEPFRVVFAMSYQDVFGDEHSIKFLYQVPFRQISVGSDFDVELIKVERSN
jgi:hypothetical protein